MAKQFLLVLLYLFLILLPLCNTVDYEYYYYYEDELPPSKTEGGKQQAQEQLPDYDLTELVAAWKEYIRDKAEKEAADQEVSNQRPQPPVSGSRRPRPSATQQHRPRPDPVVYEDYEDEITSLRRPSGTSSRRRRPKPRPEPVAYEDYDEEAEIAFRQPAGTGSRRRRPRPKPRPDPVIYEDYDEDSFLRPAVESGTRRQRPRPRRPRPRPVYDDYEEYECEPRSESYRVPDPKMCDKYFECNIKGEESEHLCPDGLVYDEKSQNCDYPSKVECGNRKELQPPQPSKNCPRANGFFAWPAEESCQKFWDCRGGASYLQICPQGVIFDMTVDSCVTPDQSKREECQAEKFLKYDCPNYSSEESLRFGNHDRLPDPDDCQKFYSCLRDGQPRLGVCPRKTVFNNATGLCDDPKTVPSCENFWKDKEKEELQDYYDYDYS